MKTHGHGSPDLRLLLGTQPKPVKPSHQRGLEGCGHGKRRSRGCGARVFAAFSTRLGFYDSLRQLLDEKRHAVGALDDLFHGMPREGSAARDPLHQRRTLTPVEAAEGEHRNVRLSGPWRLKLGPERNQQ